MQDQLMQQSYEFESPDDEEGASFGEILNTLWLRKRLIITVTLLISLLASLVIFQLTPRYKANTQLLIGTDSSKVVDIQSVMANNLMGDSAVLGEMEVIKSRTLAKRVVNSLHLDRVKEFNPSLKEESVLAFLRPSNWIPEEYQQAMGLVKLEVEKTEEEQEAELLSRMADAFLGKVKVSQIKRSQVVTIEVESESPRLAAKMANTLADKYIVGQLEAKFDATKKATDWLNDQLADLKIKVESSERAVELYRQEHDITEDEGAIGLSQQELSGINSQLIIAKAQNAEAAARVRQVQRLIKQGGEIGSVSEVLNSMHIQRLKEQEAELQRKYSQMSLEFGKKHPKMVHIQAELTDIKLRIQSEVQKIAVSLQNELELARTREQSLRSSLRQVQRETGGDRVAEVGLRALELRLIESYLKPF